MTTTDRAAGVASPCRNVCTMDERTGWCVGCFRTLAEIAAWSTLGDDGKRAVLERLAARREGEIARCATAHDLR